MIRPLITATAVALAMAAPSEGAAPSYCRDALPGARQYSDHIVRSTEMEVKGVRYHGCGRWKGSRERLWFRFTAHERDFGPVSWWVRATWKGDHWHYYNQGINATGYLS